MSELGSELASSDERDSVEDFVQDESPFLHPQNDKFKKEIDAIFDFLTSPEDNRVWPPDVKHKSNFKRKTDLYKLNRTERQVYYKGKTDGKLKFICTYVHVHVCSSCV